MPTPTETLLRYRPWRGTLRGPLAGAVAIARSGLRLMFRRKQFWALYGLAALIFFFFFYAQYLVVWLQMQTANQTVMVAGFRFQAGDLFKFLDRLALNGSAHTFGNFIWFEGYAAMIVLALAGAVLVGNDFQHGSLPFYLAKPIGRRHYVLGKCLAVGAFVNLLTTLPALILYFQAGLLYDWKSYYFDHLRELGGILGYGLLLTVSLSLLLVTTAVALRRTVPLVMVWSGLFALAPVLAGFLAIQLEEPRWRLIDLWNNLYLVGLWLLGAEPVDGRFQPQPGEAIATLVGVCAACLLYLRRRIQAVEIVS